MRAAYVGGCRPGELVQSSIRDAVSACRAFLSRPSFSSPGGSCAARSRASFAKEARRFSKDGLRRRIGVAPLSLPAGNRAGARLVSQSPEYAVGPCGDGSKSARWLLMHARGKIQIGTRNALKTAQNSQSEHTALCTLLYQTL